MDSSQTEGESQEFISIYILSGGVGASGEQLVNTVLAQFPDAPARVITYSNLRIKEQLIPAVERARDDGGLIVHTLVAEELRSELVALARQEGVPAIDLMGDLITWLQERLGRQPAGRPGLYRQLRQDYFDRVAAMEYAMDHDDGKKPQDWKDADFLLLGPSRVGKTPLSIYLSVLGWKVANAPFVPGIPMPPQLAELEQKCVIGLTIEPGQLLEHRQKRQRRLGVIPESAYANPEKIYEEVDAARKFFRRHGYPIIDVTDKPIESSADEIIHLITRCSKSNLKKREGSPE